MADLSQMTDDELNKVIETGIEPDEPESVDPVETTEAEVVEDAVEEVAEVVAEDEPELTSEVEEAPAPSRREQLRIQKLLAQYGDPTRPAPLQDRSQAIDYSQALDGDPALIEQLEADRQAYSDRAYQQGIQQGLTREWHRDLKYESPAVEKDFPFLNPKDANFRPAAADAMNQKYLRFVGYDPGDVQRGIPESVQHPNISYREFVEGEMEFADEIASQKIAQTTKNIAKQAATTGLRPDGSSAKRLNLNQSEKTMSLEELYAAIGQKPHKT